MAKTQRAERREAPDMRSTQEGRPFLEKAEAAPESLPGKKIESQSSESSWETLSFTESTLLENFPERQTQENKGTEADAVVAWLSEVTALEAQTGKPKAWKTPACEVQDRFNRLRQTSVSKVEAAQILKQEPLPETVEVPEKEKSEVLFTRPLWSNKVEYILAQVGYSVDAISFWSFSNLWLHNGGCKSGEQESWTIRGYQDRGLSRLQTPRSLGSVDAGDLVLCAG